MISLKTFLKEKYIKHPYTDYAINPTFYDIQRLINKSKYSELRLLINPENEDIYVWPSDNILHINFFKQIIDPENKKIAPFAEYRGRVSKSIKESKKNTFIISSYGTLSKQNIESNPNIKKLISSCKINKYNVEISE